MLHLLTAVIMVSSTVLPGLASSDPSASGVGTSPEPQLPPGPTKLQAADVATVALLAAIAMPSLIEARKGSNEAAAIGSLRTISTAQSLYREGDKDGDGTFDYTSHLGDLSAAHFIDDALGAGAKQGYVFIMQAGSQMGSNNTTEFTWSASADPVARGRSGDRSFYIDETGILRGTDCGPADVKSDPIGNATALAVGDVNACEAAEEELLDIGRGALSELSILSDGMGLDGAKALLGAAVDAFAEGVLPGFDLDGEGSLSLLELIEDPALLDMRFANLMGGGSQGAGEEFLDVVVALLQRYQAFLQLGAANEVVDFTVPIANMVPGSGNATIDFIDTVPRLDHFKCYTAPGESVDDVASLQDQFDIADQSSDTVKVLNPRYFCNPTRKIHADGTSAGINNVDGHLTAYGISPVYASQGWGDAPSLVAVHNQLGSRQVLKVGQPRLLLVPTQKVSVDGGTPEIGGGVPEGLDHFKCYDVEPRSTTTYGVKLWDQFDVGNSPVDARVMKAVFLCNPTRKIHHDFEHNTVTGVSNAQGHLVCYQLDAPRHVRDLVLNNQFGDGQKVSTQTSALLCIPSVKRVPQPNPTVINAFELLRAQIAALGDDAMGAGLRMSLSQLLASAQDAYAGGMICMADHQLSSFLTRAQSLRAGAGEGDEGPEESRGHSEDGPGEGKENGRGHDDDFRPGYGYGHGGTGEGGAHPPDPGAPALAEDMFNRGLEILQGMSDSFFDVFFDVFVRTSPCYDPQVGQLPGVQIMRSDNMAFEADLSFGRPQMWTVMGGGQTWTQLELPGLEARSGVPGEPAIPYWRALVGIPDGATAVMGVDPTPFLPPIDPDMPLRLNLLPFQGEAADQDTKDNRSFDDEFRDPIFINGSKFYTVDRFFPPDPCMLTPVGKYRDLMMAQVMCAAGQYNPVTDELRLFEKMSVKIEFRGGNGTFVTEQALNPFESAPSLYRDAVLNHAAVLKYVQDFDFSQLVCWGEELLILTHPNFRAAADNLSFWKETKGIATTVIEVGSGTDYATGAEIDDLIEDRFDDCIVRLSYLLLLGDAEWVPPSDTDWNSSFDECGNCGDDTTGSDWGYAVYPQFIIDVFFPDFATARMPVDTAAEADIVVGKTIQYESDPPFINFGSGGPFYTTAGFASVFQCCRMNMDGTPLGGQAGTDQRAFVETSEKARSTLVAAGKSVERMYDETVDDGGCTATPCPPNPVQQPYSGSTTPNRYYNGALMPAALRSGSGFAWDATTTDVVNSFNAGRFLMLHRGHGSTSGWADPGFSSGNLGSLSNGELLPVVYSVNCASGKWDIETDSGGTTESLMEQLLTKSDGGMVGGLGDNRNSPTWPNNALTRGFFDATWTSLAPEYGGATSHRRIGDILNHGKVYMLTQVGVAQTAGSVSLEAAVSEYLMWHAFGDPTLEMWTSNPHRISLGDLVVLEMEGFDISFPYKTEGATITVFEKTRDGPVPYGRAVVVNGNVTISPINPGDEAPPIDNLTLVASFPDAVSVELGVDQGESPGPESLSLAPVAPGAARQGESTVPGEALGAEDLDAAPQLTRPRLDANLQDATVGSAESGLGAALVASSGWIAFAGVALFAGRGPLVRCLRALRAGGWSRGGGGAAP